MKFLVFALTQALLVLVAFSMVVSSTPPFRRSLTVTVSLKLWSRELQGQRILVRSDNWTTELAINTGRSRLPFILQSCLREMWFYASRCDSELRALHIPDYQNTFADSLSRWETRRPHLL